MRLLVACSECQRQYDASRRRVGSRFRCHCGEVVTVQQPQGHDARVVRCSSCGAARRDDGPSCSYCESEITAHERDLTTVCPHCLAFVSDRARFCHYCGTGLVPELDAGADSELICPECQEGQRLISRRRGAEGVSVLECGHCAGLWMGRESFRQLVERVKRAAVPAGTIAESPRTTASKVGLKARLSTETNGGRGWAYRPCAICGELMNRRNYGRESGIIIDLCGDHGLWFDADELARILAWLRAGGGQRTYSEDMPKNPQATPTVRASRNAASRPFSFFGAIADMLLTMPD